MTGKLRVVLERHVDGRWNACYLGHQSDYRATREEALEQLRRKISGACYAVSVEHAELVDLDLSETPPVA